MNLDSLEGVCAVVMFTTVMWPLYRMHFYKDRDPDIDYVKLNRFYRCGIVTFYLAGVGAAIWGLTLTPTTPLKDRMAFIGCLAFALVMIPWHIYCLVSRRDEKLEEKI